MPYGKRLNLMTGTAGVSKTIPAASAGKVLTVSHELHPGLRTFDVEAQLIYSRDTAAGKFALPWIAYKIGSGSLHSLAGTENKATVMQMAHRGVAAVYDMTWAKERRRIQVPATAVSTRRHTKITVEMGVLLATHSAVDTSGTIYVNRPRSTAGGFTAMTPIALEYDSYIQIADIQPIGFITTEETDELAT